MKLNSKNLRMILICALALSILIFVITMSMGLSKLGEKSRAMVKLKVENQTTNDRLNNLEQAKKEVEKYAYFKQVAKTVIPSDKNQAQTILEINQMARQAGIGIQSITFPASTLGTGAAAVKTDATKTSSASTAITQAKPVPGIAGLYSLQLIIAPESGKDVSAGRQVTYPKMLDFFKRIENNRHTAQITQISIQPATDSQALSFTLIINIFIKP
jgi:hypothetical protein